MTPEKTTQPNKIQSIASDVAGLVALKLIADVGKTILKNFSNTISIDSLEKEIKALEGKIDSIANPHERRAFKGWLTRKRNALDIVRQYQTIK